MSTNNQKTIHERVLERIHQGEVVMKPRWHFVFKTLFFFTATLTVGLLLLFVISFVVFSLHMSGVWFVPMFGWHGARAFLWSLPWLLLLLALLCIVLMEILVRHYAFAYRRPVLYSTLSVLAVVTVGGLLVARTTLHREIFDRTVRHHVPFATPLYRQFSDPRFRDIHVGDVLATTQQGFTLENRRGEMLTIVVTPMTRFPLGTSIEVSDWVVVFGERTDQTVQAFGVRLLDPNEFGAMSFPHRGGIPPFLHLAPGPR